MEAAALIISHLIALAVGFIFGRIKGFNEAQPQRDKRGKFTKRS
jgi:hypothetical protein